MKINLLIALRFWKKNKLIFLLNNLGLILGIISCMVISNYAVYELSYDKFQTDSPNLYRVVSDKYHEGVLEIQNAYTDLPLGEFIKDNITGVKDFFRLHFTTIDFIMQVESEDGIKFFTEKEAYFADQEAVHYLDLKLLQGNSMAFDQPNKVLISESIATKYYGDEWQNKSIIGKSFLFKGDNKDHLFQIDGVFEDYPRNSHLTFDFLFSHNSLYSFFAGDNVPVEMVMNMMKDMWGRPEWYTYIILEENADYKEIEQEINRAHLDKIQKQNNNPNKEVFNLQSVVSIHLYSNRSNEPEINGNIKMIYALGIITLFIIMLTWSNLANLSISLNLDRAKEIGIKKLIGASKSNLTRQFLFESIFQNMMVFCLAIIIFTAILPQISDYLRIPVMEKWWSYSIFWIELAILFIITLGATGIYPVFILSSINPSKALKGELNSHILSPYFKNILIAVQFTASIILIMFTLMIYKQMIFLENKDLGMSIENKLIISVPKSIMNSEQFNQEMEVFKNSLSHNGINVAVSASTFIPGDDKLWEQKLIRIGQELTEAKVIKEIGVDRNYPLDMNLKFLAGGTFSNNPALCEQQVILNRQALDILGFDNIKAAYPAKVGVIWGSDKVGEYEIAGIVDNFHQQDPKNPFEPIALFCNIRTGYFVLSSKDKISLGAIENVWKINYPNSPFEFFFLDQHYDQQYSDDKQFARVVGGFTIFALIVAAMGIFGLTNYLAIKKLKEVTIRKITGASVTDIVILFFKYYLKFIAVAVIIGIPIALIFIYQWLDNFAFKQQISFDIIILPILLIIVLMTVSISYGTLKIAYHNPINSLKMK